MKLLHAVVVTERYGTDKVSIKTDLPSGIVGEANLYINFDVRRGHGMLYLRQHFPSITDVELIDVPHRMKCRQP